MLNAQIFYTNVGFGSFFLVTCTFPKRRLYEKFVRLTLMKLTPCLPFSSHDFFAIVKNGVYGIITYKTSAP